MQPQLYPDAPPAYREPSIQNNGESPACGASAIQPDEKSPVFCCGFFSKPDLAARANLILRNHPNLEVKSLGSITTLNANKECSEYINPEKIKYLKNKFIIDMESNQKWTQKKQDDCITQFTNNMESALGIPRRKRELRTGQALTWSSEQVVGSLFFGSSGGMIGALIIGAALVETSISATLLFAICGSTAGIIAILPFVLLIYAKYNTQINEQDTVLRRLTQTKNEALDPFIASVKNEFKPYNPLEGLGVRP